VSSQETTDYEAAMAAGSPERGFAERSGDDLFIIYTGGTTGMPKGVMWRHEDLFFSGLQGGAPSGDPVESPEEVARNAAEENYCVSMLPCAPFIHGAAQLTGFICLLTGGKLTIQPGKSFDPERVLDLVGEEEVSTLTIVGDAMAYPLLEQLQRTDKTFDVSNLNVIASAGAILSPTNKAALQALLPDVMIINSFGSTESGDLGRAADDEESVDGRPTFYMDESVTVLDEMLNPVEPGSGVIGRLARSGRLPLGYYKDEAQTNERFVTANGKRWVVPGDFATIEGDGRITFMGRGSKCINTGGEKVFPEEVEEAIKAHPDVIDALVVGVPDPKWGSTVGAVFNTKGNKPLSNEDLQAHCRAARGGLQGAARDRAAPRGGALPERQARLQLGRGHRQGGGGHHAARAVMTELDERAQRIVDTAIELAAADGFAAVRLRDVAASAGVALGTLYKRFASKEEILVAALEQESEKLLARLGKRQPEGTDPSSAWATCSTA
jgi:acyl-CoA synthetase (AMP-forming)/AMP-acid ligase II